MLNIHQIRKDYLSKSLDFEDLDADPFLQFTFWFQEAEKAKIEELNAMALATVSREGRPSCRIVLLKQMDARGLCFFTHYESRKGRDLASHPFACATFYWKELERQLIVEGKIEKLSKEDSEIYFASRPRGSQIGAWASRQDHILNSREELEKDYLSFEKMYEGNPIPMPPYWGGYRLIPDRFEFWQGRSNRLHDRFEYLLVDKKWQVNRLAP